MIDINALIAELRLAAPRNRSVLMDRAADALEAQQAKISDLIERAAQEADRGYLWGETCDDIAARIRALSDGKEQ